MAKNLQANQEVSLRQKAAGVAADTQALGDRMVDTFKGQAAEVVGQLGQQGVTEGAANPMAAGLAKNKEMAGTVARNLLEVEKDALTTKQTGIAAAKEVKDAGQTAVAAAMATISGAKTRLEGVGKWMTGPEKAEFRTIISNAIVGLTPDEQNQVRKAFSRYM